MALTTAQRWGIAAVVSLAAHGVVLVVATRRAPVPEAPRGGAPTQFVPIFDGHPPAPGGGSAKVLEPQRAPARPAAAADAPPARSTEPQGTLAPESAEPPVAPSAGSAPEGTSAGSSGAATGSAAGSGDGAAGAGSGTGSGGTGTGVGTGTGAGAVAPSNGCRVEVGRQLAERARAEVPRAVRDRGLVGQVVLTFTVGDGGVVEGARVEASSGHPLLDDAALALLRRPLTTDCRGQYRLPFLWHLPTRR